MFFVSKPCKGQSILKPASSILGNFRIVVETVSHLDFVARRNDFGGTGGFACHSVMANKRQSGLETSRRNSRMIGHSERAPDGAPLTAES
jgi:hypothetical protein